MKKDKGLTRAQKYELWRQIMEEGRKVLTLNGGKDIKFVREK